MTVFTKDPRSPEVIEEMKKQGRIVLEVTLKQLYILHGGADQHLEQLMEEWFKKWRGRSHAYRDGSHVGGADEVVAVHNLTEGGRAIVTERPTRTPEEDAECQRSDKEFEDLCVKVCAIVEAQAAQSCTYATVPISDLRQMLHVLSIRPFKTMTMAESMAKLERDKWTRSAKYPGYEERTIDGHLHTRPKV